MSEFRADFDPRHFHSPQPYQHEDTDTDTAPGLFLLGVVVIGVVLFILYSVSTSYFATLNPPQIGGESVVPKNSVMLTIPQTG